MTYPWSAEQDELPVGLATPLPKAGAHRHGQGRQRGQCAEEVHARVADAGEYWVEEHQIEWDEMLISTDRSMRVLLRYYCRDKALTDRGAAELV